MHRITNTSKAPHVLYDQRGKRVTIQPNEAKDVDLHEGHAARIEKAKNHPLKIESVGLSRATAQKAATAPAKTGKEIQDPRKSGGSEVDKKSSQKPSEQNAEQNPGEADGSNPGEGAGEGGEGDADAGDVDKLTPAQLADKGEKNQLSHWAFVKAAKAILGDAAPSKKADIIEALRKLPAPE
jgi:hypothetical protein